MIEGTLGLLQSQGRVDWLCSRTEVLV